MPKIKNQECRTCRSWSEGCGPDSSKDGLCKLKPGFFGMNHDNWCSQWVGIGEKTSEERIADALEVIELILANPIMINKSL